MLNSLIENSKIEFSENRVDKSQNDSKALWETVKDICGKTKNINVEIIKNKSGYLTYDKKEFADCFNNHYFSVGRNLANKIQQPINYLLKKVSTAHSLFMKPTTEKQIIETITCLEINRTPGIDEIRAESLKEMKTEIAFPLTNIINKIIETGRFPKEVEIGVIEPVYR
ncbi:hypothetical protein JTB14_005151 [Gonioctena quinquepunctata]|nr:hypothetical protein JTB14_005151 [Gonioctena quinquepunctata]